MGNRSAPLAALLAALLALPLPALAAAPTYPREVVRKGKICVERLDGDGTLLVDCKDARPAPVPEAEAIAGAEAGPGPAAAPADGARDPVAQGRKDGEADADRGTYFLSGLLGGGLLGPVGCLGVAFAGQTSEPTPPLAGRWESEADERAYRVAYDDELQAERTGQAILGGTAGILLVLGVIGVVYLSRDE